MQCAGSYAGDDMRRRNARLVPRAAAMSVRQAGGHSYFDQIRCTRIISDFLFDFRVESELLRPGAVNKKIRRYPGVSDLIEIDRDTVRRSTDVSSHTPCRATILVLG